MPTDPAAAAGGPLHRQWRSLALVFLGGVVGTLLRYGAEREFPADGWPWATFVVNCVGTAVLGLLLAALTMIGPDTGRRVSVRLLVGVGFCGSLTTYSAFALESDRLFGGGRHGLAIGYVIGTVVAGLLFATVGYGIGRTVGRRVAERR